MELESTHTLHTMSTKILKSWISGTNNDPFMHIWAWKAHIFDQFHAILLVFSLIGWRSLKLNSERVIYSKTSTCQKFLSKWASRLGERYSHQYTLQKAFEIIYWLWTTQPLEIRFIYYETHEVQKINRETSCSFPIATVPIVEWPDGYTFLALSISWHPWRLRRSTSVSTLP